jgi:hypothetical protein
MTNEEIQSLIKWALSVAYNDISQTMAEISISKGIRAWAEVKGITENEVNEQFELFKSFSIENKIIFKNPEFAFKNWLTQ